MKAYIHSTLSMEYGREGDKPSELQLAFHHLQAELAKREKVSELLLQRWASCKFC